MRPETWSPRRVSTRNASCPPMANMRRPRRTRMRHGPVDDAKRFNHGRSGDSTWYYIKKSMGYDMLIYVAWYRHYIICLSTHYDITMHMYVAKILTMQTMLCIHNVCCYGITSYPCIMFIFIYSYIYIYIVIYTYVCRQVCLKMELQFWQSSSLPWIMARDTFSK